MESSSPTDAELRSRVRQQEVVAELGQQALETDDLDRLMQDASVAVAETLGNEYCKVLELLPGGDEVLLRRGVGWRDGLVGDATVPTDLDSQAGYTLISEEPVIVVDLREEERFSGPELLTSHDVVSGISVVIGSVEDPWGVLGTHTTDRRAFTDHDANFVQSVANVLGAAIDRSEKERRVHEREAKLERYGEFTDEILNAVDDMFYVVDETGAFQRWNESLTEVTGYADAEIASMEPLEFIAEEDREAIANGIVEIFETGSSRVEADVLTKDGARVPYEFVAARLENPDGELVLAGIGRDISERRAHEEELAKYETIVETIDDGIYVKDADGYFTTVNDAYAALTGYDREELIGEHASLVVDEGTIEQSKEVLSADEDTDRSAVEAEILTADGDHVPAEGTFATLQTGDGEQREVGVVRDITQRKRREQQLEASNERLEQFAYAASHDLQEPLRMVSSYLQLIEDRYADRLDEEGREFFEFAVDGADRMREMIAGLLEYSRVDSSGNPLEPIDLGVVVDEAREDLQVKVEEHGAEITVDELPRVRGDAGQLRQVFQNLLDNAIEYSDDESPRVHVSAESDGVLAKGVSEGSSDVLTASDGDEWIVSVTDEGIGIDPADEERIFDVFERLHAGQRHEGTGIGLALCERIVERHGGEIWVDSEPGEGATFSFTLPAVSERDA